MAAYRRPLSASSYGSQSSVVSLDSFLSSSARSHPSSLEDTIVKEYLDRIERPTTKCRLIPCGHVSPYAKTSARPARGRPRVSPSEHLTASSLESIPAADDSTREDQKASAQCANADSDAGLEKPAKTGNPRVSSQAKRNRPLSAPQGHPRYAKKNHQESPAGYETMPLFLRQPQVIRATAYRNGELTMPVKVSAPTIQLLLERCTKKLKLNIAARRIFLANGREAFEPKDVPQDCDIYVSSGEPFKDPMRSVKDDALLSGKVTWTMNGLKIPSSKRTEKTKCGATKKSPTNQTGRILVFENGNGKDDHVISASFDKMEEFLDLCTSKLDLGSSAKWIFDVYGDKVGDLRNIPVLDKCLQSSITYLRGPVWISKGEGFSPTGAKIYIQGVMSALHQRLKSARRYGTQLENYMNGQTDEISRKEILSMTEEELYLVHEEVNKQIDELRAAIREHQTLLRTLAPQLQAEQEQCATYVYQHIKPLPGHASLPPGLNIKVYENGKDFGGVLVYISRKDLQQPLQELLEVIQCKLQRSSEFSAVSCRLSRIYDEKGQEIKSLQSLQDEQKVWVSCGEDFRPPVDNILSMNFDKVVWTEKDGRQVIYKTFEAPDAALPGYGSHWCLHSTFPDNVSPVSPQSCRSEVVEADSLFLQLKIDLQTVLHPSLMIEKRSRQSGRKGTVDESLSALPTCNVWLITKAGMILSKAMPQICLAVGQPIMLCNAKGALIQGYRLTLQKRGRNQSGQLWSFSNKGSISPKDYPDFVLTHLEEINLKEAMHQIENSNERNDVPSPFSVDIVTTSEQLSQAQDARAVPAGGPGEARQLTVALVRNLEEKHPKASAQRWAIKHEGLSKPGQWKASKVENPVWNKRTYLWPVLPDGETNQDFDWPIQGSLIANSPPLQRPAYSHPDHETPVRLKVLRNGEGDPSKACVIVGPDLTNMLKKQNKQKSEKNGSAEKRNERSTETNLMKVEQIEMQQFLERCTQIMNLPAAARRLFNENGDEISYLREVERDQLVYVSCGELWIDPGLSASEQKRQLLFSSLSSDVSFIRNYCCLRNPENLALEVNGDIVAGARLSVNDCAAQPTGEEQNAGTAHVQEEQCDDATVEEAETTHQRTHKKIDALFTDVKYSWQRPPEEDPEEVNDATTEENNTQQEKSMYRVPRKWKQLYQQQFEYVDGQIVSSAVPDLVLGVAQARAGAEVLLVGRNPDDLGQRWKYLRENRTLHLASNPDLVLAVSLPKIYPGLKENEINMAGCAVILQKYEEHINGAANQKWSYDEGTKRLMAFYSDQLDKEISAANHTSVCTFTIKKMEEISQPGYLLTSVNHNEEYMICVSCARSLRPTKEMKRVTVGAMFSCASGVKESRLSPLGPFKCLHVGKTDLSTSEAYNTLDYFSEVLLAMRPQHNGHTMAGERLVTGNKRAVKVMAFKNGNGFKNGKLLIAGTFLELLDLCTKELELPRPACRLYTMDGTVVLDLQSLIAWLVKDFFQQPKEQIWSEENQSKNQNGTTSDTDSTVQGGPESRPVDEYLLSHILRHPIKVWASCGEPFVSLHAVQKSERREKINWKQKKPIISDHSVMKHKIRQLQARRVKSLSPPNLVPTTNPALPVSVEGGWTEVTSEEMRLKEDIHHVEKRLSDIRAPRVKIHPAVANSEKPLYTFPVLKRALVYKNGGNAEQAVYAWGKSLEEFLEDCTLKLSLGNQPAAALYNSDGQLVTSWNDIKKDMLLCVSVGEAFITKKTSRDQIEVRANYARIRKKYGPQATDVIISMPTNILSTSALIG